MQTGLFVPSAEIERETGFGNDQLRKWRQRYGFPLLSTAPDSAVGYSSETVGQLLAIKRLLEGGYRPGQVVGKSPMELARLRRGLADRTLEACLSPSTLQLIELVKHSKVSGLRALLAKARAIG